MEGRNEHRQSYITVTVIEAKGKWDMMQNSDLHNNRRKGSVAQWLKAHRLCCQVPGCELCPATSHLCVLAQVSSPGAPVSLPDDNRNDTYK